jgi:diguanylate cyclase (GGDEF)-like protein
VLLEERVKQALQQANHHKLVTLMAINLDGFKAINDSMGHKVGDGYLIEIANRIRAVVDEQFTVSRTSGNDFMVVLEQTAPEDAAVFAEKIINVVKQPMIVDGKELVTTASIGIAVSFISGNNYEDLAFHAGAAMQHTKQTGKNGYHYYEDKMDVDAARKLELISHLRHAIERNELTLYYQPQFDVKTGCVHSAEALLRWEGADFGFISPEQFIPLAEESGLIVDIGDWVLNQACRQLHEWTALGYDDINVALNLSSTQFVQENLYQKIVGALEFWGVGPERLTLEITESTAMQNVEHSLKVLQKIVDLGVKVSIDDFGTGYSSLLYLKRFPASELKIDRGFIKMLSTDSGDGLLVSAIIALGHQFGLKVVAEGVETQWQKDMLTDLKCDTMQGFFLGKPRASEEFFGENRAYMKKHKKKVDEAPNGGMQLLTE